MRFVGSAAAVLVSAFALVGCSSDAKAGRADASLSDAPHDGSLGPAGDAGIDGGDDGAVISHACGPRDCRVGEVCCDPCLGVCAKKAGDCPLPPDPTDCDAGP